MSNAPSVSKQESRKHDVRIKVLLNKLRNKLKGLKVMDQQGLLVGEVKDVGLDVDRQLNLLVSLLDADQSPSLVLIRSKHIQQIEPATEAVFINLSKAEIQVLPQYVRRDKASAEVDIPTVAVTTGEDSTQLTTPANAYAQRPDMPTSAELENYQEEPIPEDESLLDSTAPLDIVEEEIIRLLAERLVVDTTKQKVGEVIVRKQIETRMVQIPIRREVLIVEQVSPERKQLAEIDLGQAQNSGIELAETASLNSTPDHQLSVRGEFDSPRTASHILDAIAHQRRHGCAKVRVEVILEDTEHQKTYQEWFDRCSTNSPLSSKK